MVYIVLLPNLGDFVESIKGVDENWVFQNKRPPIKVVLLNKSTYYLFMVSRFWRQIKDRK